MVFKQGFLKTSIGQTNKCRNKLSPLVSVSSWSEYFNFYGIWTLIKLHCENGVNVLVPHPYKMTPHFSGHHRWEVVFLFIHVMSRLDSAQGGGGDSSAFHFYKHSHGTHETHVSTCCSWSAERDHPLQTLILYFILSICPCFIFTFPHFVSYCS